MSAYRLIQPKDVASTVVSLHAHLETVRQGEMDRVRGRLGRLSPDAETAIESLTRGIIHKISLPAITALETATAKNDSTYLAEIVHRIFNLGEKRKREDLDKDVHPEHRPARIDAAGDAKTAFLQLPVLKGAGT